MFDPEPDGEEIARDIFLYLMLLLTGMSAIYAAFEFILGRAQWLIIP